MKNRSKIFDTEIQTQIEEAVIKLVNSEKGLMSKRALQSPRAVGDIIQGLLENKFDNIVPKGILKEFNSSFARRSMADFAFTDKDDFYYVVDNKTHNLDTKFNMPNLTSVERLARFYEDDSNYFILLLIAYKVVNDKLKVKSCRFVPIEHIDWKCLTIGALGWGQIQIANSNNIVINPKQTRKKWILGLCDRLEEFYPKEIGKVKERIKHFEKIRKNWESKEDF